MRPGRGRPAAIAAAAAITNQSHHRRSSTPVTGAVGSSLSTTTAKEEKETPNKSKQCIVRLEKVNKKDELNEKKSTATTTSTTSSGTTIITTTGSTGPNKKRPSAGSPSPSATTTTLQVAQKKGRKQTITEKSTTVSAKMHVDEDLSDYNLATARARRTPKPNPRYNSQDLVKSYSKSMKGEQSDDDNESYQEDFDSADDFEVNSSDVKDDIADSDDEFAEESGTKTTKRSKSTPPTLQKGRIKPMSQSLQQNIGNKRKLGVDERGRDTYSIGYPNKRLNLDINDANDNDASSPRNKIIRNAATKQLSSSSATLDAHRQSLLRPMLRSVQQQQQQQLQKHQGDTSKSKTIQILERRKENLLSSASSLAATQTVKRFTKNNNIDNDVKLASTGSAATVDDFETMPTFTIVNINDIINKKSDEILKIDAVKNIESKSQQNRRRTVHTIASEKSNTDISTTRTPFNSRKVSTQLNNNSKTTTLPRTVGDNTKSNAPPRILNSVVGKKTRPISPIVSPKEVRKLPSLLPATTTTSSNSSPSYIQRQSKENVSSGATIANKNLTSTISSSTSSNSSTMTKELPNDRVIVQRQGNKLVKKVTCFEKWYVINVPKLYQSTSSKEKQDEIKQTLDMSLVQLGNHIKEVQLPINWNYKVTLQKLSPTQLKDKNFEPYTGDVNDENISGDDKMKYQPINIMFRRANKNAKIRTSFDRAIIFKNQSYLMNIDGKNIHLCDGAPTSIKSIDDINILLEILDELTIDSEFIEPSSFYM